VSIEEPFTTKGWAIQRRIGRTIIRAKRAYDTSSFKKVEVFDGCAGIDVRGSIIACEVGSV
jgi:hypothetical protein